MSYSTAPKYERVSQRRPSRLLSPSPTQARRNRLVTDRFRLRGRKRAHAPRSGPRTPIRQKQARPALGRGREQERRLPAKRRQRRYCFHARLSHKPRRPKFR
jgi:hypothetical protein